MRKTLLGMISIFFTWGFPILGGYIGQSNMGFRNTFMVVSIIQSLSLLLLIFATPETSFDRSPSPTSALDPSLPSSNLPSRFGSTIVTTITTSSNSPFKVYLKTLRLTTPHSTSRPSMGAALLVVRELAAPSTILTTLLTGPLLATAFGLAHSLSLLFSAMPTLLFPEHLGYLFILPLVFALVLFSLTGYIAHLRTRTFNGNNVGLGMAIPGVTIGIAGLLAFGFYTAEKLSPEVVDDGKGAVFALVTELGQDLSLKVVSALFGLLVSGAVVTSFAGETRLTRSSTSAKSGGEQSLDAAGKVLQEIVVGIFVIAFPLWIKGSDGMLPGLKMTAVALSVVVLVLGTSVGALMWAKNEQIREMDRKVMGVRRFEGERWRDGEAEGGDGLKLQRWKTNKSFFDET